MAANGGLTSLHVPALATDPVKAGTLYAGTDGGVFRSTDGGESWTAVNNGLGPLSLQVQALALDPTGATTLYAGLSVSLPGDVWQSTPPAPRGVDTDLELALSGLPDPATGGFPLTYALSVLNKGPGDARSISVSQTLPSGVTFDWAEGAGWTCGQSAGTVTCVMPALELGQASSITVQVTPGPVAAVLVSTADVTAEGVDPDPANNSASQTTTVNAPLVWMGTPTQTVVADSGRFQPGAGVTYTITLTNAGTVPQTDNPGNELDGTLPYSLTLTSASATSGTPWFDSSGFFGWNGGLPSGGSVILTIHATIKPTVTIGTTIANQATIHYDADGNGTNEATAQTDDPGAPGANDPTTFVVVSPAMSYYTLGPCRLVDTRNPDGPFGGPALVAGGNRVFPTFGHCNIPSTAHAISVNLTVTQPTAAGHLRLYPAGAPLPLTSSLNYSAGQTRPNDAVALLSGYGSLAVRCTQSTGTVHFILDVNGYFE